MRSESKVKPTDKITNEAGFLRKYFRSYARSLLVGILAILLPCACFAADFFIDGPNGASSDSNPGTEAFPWRTISKANSTLRAGDTVHIKAGTYNSYINPVNSGNATSRITYKSFVRPGSSAADEVIISNTRYAIFFDGKDYVTVIGIKATLCTQFVVLTNQASNNQIIDSSFYIPSDPNQWPNSFIAQGSQYNHLLRVRFERGGFCRSSDHEDQGAVLDIGDESSIDLTRFNLIENSEFYHGGHHVIGLYGESNTFRNNYLHNENWADGISTSDKRGNRALYLNGQEGNTGKNLIEGNRFGYSGKPCDYDNPDGSNRYGPSGIVAISTPQNIFRYNSVYYGFAYGVGTSAYSGYTAGRQNRFYHNTFFANGHNIPSAYLGGGEDCAFQFRKVTNVENVLVSNLFFSHRNLYRYHESAVASTQGFVNNYNGDSQGDPRFVGNPSIDPPTDVSGYDFRNQAAPDLRLTLTSPAKNFGPVATTVSSTDSGAGVSLLVTDAAKLGAVAAAPAGLLQPLWIAVGSESNVGQIASISGNTVTLRSAVSRTAGASIWILKNLTTVAAADSGAGLTLVLADASYFQDGTKAPPGTVEADWISVGTKANHVQITQISGNTVTLSQSITRNDNDPVWLFKKSDGEQVFQGSAPDAGAFEYSEDSTPGTPAAPQNLKVN